MRSKVSLKKVENAVRMLSWKLLKRELDQSKWIEDCEGVLRVILRCNSLVLKHPSSKLKTDRDVFFAAVIEYMKDQLPLEFSSKFEAAFYNLKVVSDCFEYIADFEKDFDSLKEMSAHERVWGVLERYCKERGIIHQRLRKELREAPYIFLNSISISDDNGNRVDPDGLENDIAKSVASAILMECYREGWFDGSGACVIPKRIPVSDKQISMVGANISNAATWAVLDNAQLQYRFLGRGFHIQDPKSIEGAPSNLNFAISVSAPTKWQKIEYVSNARTIQREAQNSMDLDFIKFAKNLKLGLGAGKKFGLDELFSIEERSAVNSLSLLLNYDVELDEEEYFDLTLREWIRAYCVLKDYVWTKLGEYNDELEFSLIDVTEEKLIELLVDHGLSEKKSRKYIDLISYGKSSKDLFDHPLIRTSDGFCLASASLSHSVISRVVASNILNRGGRFKTKGRALEDKVLGIFNDSGVMAVPFKKKYSGEEYEYDALVLWDGKLFVIECKNRWLTELNPILSSNVRSQLAEDVAQVKRLVDGLHLHPEMVKEAFGMAVSYDEIVPCIVHGTPFAFYGLNNFYVTDVSIVHRFFSDRFLSFASAEKGDLKSLVPIKDQWGGEQPTAQSFIQTIHSPLQVKMNMDFLLTRESYVTLGELAVLRVEEFYEAEVRVGEYFESMGVDRSLVPEEFQI